MAETRTLQSSATSTHPPATGILDRSKCLFPASSKNTDAKGWTSIEHHLCETKHAEHAATLSASLKVAWVLTLQCFIIADVFCFGYNGPKHHNDESQDHSKTTTNLYVMRIDREMSVASLRAYLGKAEPGSPPVDNLETYEINIVDGQSPSHQSNTALSYRTDLSLRCVPDLTDSELQNIDLRMVVTMASDSSLDLRLYYRLSHTEEELAWSVLNTFKHIFVQINNASDTLLINNVDLCPPAHRELIRRFTSNISPVKEMCLHELIIDQCRKRPNQLAIRSWDGDLTYAELNDLSSRLASHLVILGVRPETFVLNCFEKSTWAIVARLAVLRAGGAYISVHASNPPAYLASVITRTKTTILLTDSTFADQFRNVVPTLVELSPTWLRSLPEAAKEPICKDVRADNACLILFTSGSTGTPKGIVQIHSSYATAIQDYARNFHLGTHTRFLHFDDYAFDISNLEFLVPLLVGGICCVPGPMKTVEDLAEQIRTLDANIIFLTPTVAIKMEPKDVPSLKTICVGGEPLTKDLVEKWSAQSTRVVNQYGMGEVAICCAYNDQVNHREGSKIGRPSSGAIWLVDRASPENLVPVGGVGEIIIEGAHLSRGYIDPTAIHRTEAGFLKMAPRWLAEVHPGRSQYRMYRSGDLGRMSADGTITYLGRKDTILKLDGCRIDALEVEHQARKFLSDKDFIVVDLLGTINGRADPALTAFLYLDDHSISAPPVINQPPRLRLATEDPQTTSKIQQIQKGIGLSLPKYMIPTLFVLVSWIPRTPSKKVDRKKIHVLGQQFYTDLSDEFTKDGNYAKRMKVLPP